jgi:type I restriction enzyme M protein
MPVKHKRKAAVSKTQSADLDRGFEATMWAAADKLRGSMDASEYKHIVLGLIFLKYISDSFEEHYQKLQADPTSDPEDRDEYIASNVFWVPKEARWSGIQASAKSPGIGKRIDDAMLTIERENPRLKTILPKEYAHPDLDPVRIGGLIDLISKIGLGDAEARKKDILGRVYEYFLGRFASAEGKAGGEFYTPRCVVQLLVEMIEPFKGRVFDPACGSGGMFVQSEEFVLAHGGKVGDISIYGQESNPTTWRLCEMNLAIRGIDAHVRWNNGGSFHQDAHPDLKADFIMANPPFNESDWGGGALKGDKRWKYGIPPEGNSNFAWMQHFVYHLSPTGVAGFVMANGSMSSNQSGEGDIRKALIEDNLVDCMIALPGQLFYTTQIPVCVWIIARDRRNQKFRDRRGEILFIDARTLGAMTDRTHKVLRSDDIEKIAGAYHAWRSKEGGYADMAGFCKSTPTEEIKKHGYVLTPGRYVGTQDAEDDAEPFDERMQQLVGILQSQYSLATTLDKEIADNLKQIGYGS